MQKLFGLADIKIISDNPKSTGAWIPPTETSEVLKLVSESSYVLYSMYRTYPFKESSDIDDAAMGKLLHWSPRKVQKHRLLLQAAQLFRVDRIGSNADGLTRVYVGTDVVALANAGLPAEILNPKALNKLKKEFGVKTSADLVSVVPGITRAYEQNPNQYN